jgi:hypothetical protein
MSSHPNPGNRTVYINKEAESLTIASPADQSQFNTIKTQFAGMPAALTMAELAKRQKEGTATSMQSVGTPGQPVPRPSAQYQPVTGGKVFQAQVPSNWTSLSTSNAIRVVPENGFGQLNGQTVFSHGIEFGIAQAGSKDLRQATIAWLKALMTPLANASQLGGQELISLYTTFLADGGTLFYYLTIVPEKDSANFQETFSRIAQSIQLTDRR